MVNLDHEMKLRGRETYLLVLRKKLSLHMVVAIFDDPLSSFDSPQCHKTLCSLSLFALETMHEKKCI